MLALNLQQKISIDAFRSGIKSINNEVSPQITLFTRELFQSDILDILNEWKTETGKEKMNPKIQRSIMKKRYKRGILLSTLTTASLLVASQGFGAFVGAHPDVTLKTWNTPGDINSGKHATTQNETYNPRATCSGCHSETVDENTNTAARINGAAQGGYHGGGATKTVVKTQGVQNQATDEVEWVSFNTKAYKHGFSTSRHSQEGRDEDYGHNMRVAWGAKYFENSGGMFGKY